MSTVEAGIAKAMPTLPPDGEKIAVLTPTTSPARLKVGPPELPRLIGASICRKSSYGPAPMSRCWAETMPAVTVPPRPNGLPTASTQSPTRAFWEASFTIGEVAALDLEQGEVGLRIGADHLRVAGAAVVQRRSEPRLPFSTTWLLVTR